MGSRYLQIDPLPSAWLLSIEKLEKFQIVGRRGLEPPHLAAHAPKACVSTNFTTCPYLPIINNYDLKEKNVNSNMQTNRNMLY